MRVGTTAGEGDRRSDQAHEQRKRESIRRLKVALAEGRLTLKYQPIFAAADGRALSAEALLRPVEAAHAGARRDSAGSRPGDPGGPVIEMAHRLGLGVSAEGIETDGQLSHLKAHGCDALQGFLLAEAWSPEELVRRLTAG